MLFSESRFFAFFAVYFLLHVLVPKRFRVYLIIAGSTVFYAWWRVDYIWVPYLLTFIAYFGVWWIERATTEADRKQRLIASLIALFTPLAIVKYTYFFVHGVLDPLFPIEETAGDLTWLRFALPLGISFVTFTLTAYIIDVYRGKYPPEAKLSLLSAYVLFFPHLIAGPILRPHELMPQLERLRSALDARFTLGAALFALGLIKKVVFADSLGAAVDGVYAANANPTGWEYILAIYGFSLQIYCDFSGYTDMAIGLAYILGIRLPTNFLRPYSADSIIDFWRRWHITLSHWLRDYLYIPLGGNRKGNLRQFYSVMITMTLGGLWHGADWTFLIWGFLHGLGIAVTHIMRKSFKSMIVSIPSWVAIFGTFHFVTFVWIYFRAPDLATAHRVMAGPFLAQWPDVSVFAGKYAFELFLLSVFLVTHTFDRHARIRYAVQRYNRGLVWGGVMIAFLIATVISQGSSARFIYYDF